MKQLKAGGITMNVRDLSGRPFKDASSVANGFEVPVVRTKGWLEQGPRRRGLPSPWY